MLSKEWHACLMKRHLTVVDDLICVNAETTRSLLPIEPGSLYTPGVYKCSGTTTKISHSTSTLFKWGGPEGLRRCGNVALETCLVCEAIFQSGSEVGRSGLCGASLSSAYYLTEWTGPRRVRDVTKSKACWVGPLCDCNEPVQKSPVTADKSPSTEPL